MEIGVVSVLSASFLVLLVTSVMSSPIDVASRSTDEHVEEKRPKYMDTRDLDAFKELVWRALLQLAAEEKINPDMIDVIKDGVTDKDAPEKKASRAHLRICVRRSGGHFIPFPCYRRGRG